MAEQLSEQELEKTLEFTLADMNLSEQERLSRALFPESHTDKVELLGKERLLRPLPVKHARKIKDLVTPLMESLGAITQDEPSVPEDLDEKILSNLFSIAKSLAEFYGDDWADVKKAAADEDLSISELESLALTQANLCTVNDFLLRPLRALVRFLQVQEIATVRMESLESTPISLRSSKGGIAASTT